MRNPCKRTCPRRTATCHGSCPDYAIFCEGRERIRKQRAEVNDTKDMREDCGKAWYRRPHGSARAGTNEKAARAGGHSSAASAASI